MKRLYLLLALIGFILPYYFFVSFLMRYGFDLQELVNQLFANDISTFFAVDVLITVVVLCLFIYQQAHEGELPRWGIYITVTLLVGPSCAIPLYLYAR